MPHPPSSGLAGPRSHRIASQAGSMRLAAWEALRSHSHCVGEERRGGRAAGGGWPSGCCRCGLWVEALQGGGEAPTEGSSRPLTLHILLSASLNDRRHRHSHYPLFNVLRDLQVSSEKPGAARRTGSETQGPLPAPALSGAGTDSHCHPHLSQKAALVLR